MLLHLLGGSVLVSDSYSGVRVVHQAPDVTELALGRTIAEHGGHDLLAVVLDLALVLALSVLKE